MRDAREVLSDAAARGVDLWIEDERLRFRAPATVVSPDFIEELRAQKSELIGLLSGADRPDSQKSAGLVIKRMPRKDLVRFYNQRVWRKALGRAEVDLQNTGRLIRLNDGAMDPALLGEALRNLAERHTILKTSIANVDGTGFLRFDREHSLTLDHRDLGDVSDDAMRELAASLAWEPFDLENGPLIRVFQLVGTQGAMLGVIISTIIADDISVDIICEELAGLYANLKRESTEMPAAHAQYADYALSVEAAPRSYIDHQIKAWRDLLSSVESTKLPFDKHEKGVPRTGPAVENFEIDQAQLKALRDFARGRQVTMFAVLMAMHDVALWAATQASEVTMAVPHYGRGNSLQAGMVGNFSTTTYYRAHVAPNMTFAAVLNAVWADIQEDWRAQGLPFDVVQEFDPTLSSDVFVPAFALVPYQTGNQQKRWKLLGSPVDLKPPARTKSARTPYRLMLKEREKTLSGRFLYKREFYTEATVRDFVALFLTVLREAVRNPDAPISRFRKSR